MTVTSSLYNPPEIPSKWDIIPIHNSDRGSFKRCRRYWDWNSPARQNLTLRADVHGINIPMWFGTGIHYALENYYNPGLKRDPVEVWKTWFDIQWRGGIVDESWLDKVYDLKPQSQGIHAPQAPNTEGQYEDAGSEVELWRVMGLEDIIPDPDHNEFDELYELGVQMMRFYKDYAEARDDFDVLMVEHTFSIPVWDYENNCILKAYDRREDSPNYGKLLEVHARGRQDGITQRHGASLLGIIDHKTTADNPLNTLDSLLPKLDADEQCTTYLYVAEVEANYYDLPHKEQPFEEVIYNVLRKAYPKPPTELKNGMFSVDRQNESTTYELLMAWINKNMPGVPLSEKQQGYVEYLEEADDRQFIYRHPVRRNKHQLRNAGYRMYLETLDMLVGAVNTYETDHREPRIYPNLTNDFRCLGCQFRSPCLAMEDGSDWEQLIADNYTKNKDR